MDSSKYFAAVVLTAAMVVLAIWSPIDINIRFGSDQSVDDVATQAISTQTVVPVREMVSADICEETFMVVEQMPVLVGGFESIKSKLLYPQSAKADSVEGRVFVQFVVSSVGDVENAIVIRGADSRLDAEALRVVEEVKFEPGQQRGKNVCVKMSLPVTFRL